MSTGCVRSGSVSVMFSSRSTGLKRFISPAMRPKLIPGLMSCVSRYSISDLKYSMLTIARRSAHNASASNMIAAAIKPRVNRFNACIRSRARAYIGTTS